MLLAHHPLGQHPPRAAWWQTAGLALAATLAGAQLVQASPVLAADQEDGVSIAPAVLMGERSLEPVTDHPIAEEIPAVLPTEIPTDLEQRPKIIIDPIVGGIVPPDWLSWQLLWPEGEVCVLPEAASESVCVVLIDAPPGFETGVVAPTDGLEPTEDLTSIETMLAEPDPTPSPFASVPRYYLLRGLGSGGPITPTPGPLPIAGALMGWDAACRLRRRCRQRP